VYSDIVGAVVIIMSAILAVETRRRWLKVILWGVFFLAVITQVVIQRREREREVSAADAQTQKRDQVIDNMNGQLGVMLSDLNAMSQAFSRFGSQLQTQVKPPAVSIKPAPASSVNSLSDMTDQQLVDYERNFADKLIAFERQHRLNMIQTQFNMWSNGKPFDPNSPEQQQAWRAQTTAISQDYVNYEMDYKKMFWADALALRDEFSRRYMERGKLLPAPQGLTQLIALDPGSIAGPSPLGDVAAYFNYLAQNLPHPR
jgi:hypothetical protein